MKAFIDENRDDCGVDPICRVLPIPPSTYHKHAARRAHPSRLPARASRDEILKVGVRRVFNENFGVDAVRKVWLQMKRKGLDVARCTVSRLMFEMSLKGVVRGKTIRTTIRNASAPCPRDLVNRDFKAPRPNMRWVSDFLVSWDYRQHAPYHRRVSDTFPPFACISTPDYYADLFLLNCPISCLFY